MDQLGLWNVFEECHENEETKCISGNIGKNSLYDVQNIGKILPQQPVFNSPTVHVAQACNNNIALAADGFLTVLGDGGSSYKATVNLECRIEVLCFRPDGEMIIAGDSSGVIHLISVSTCKIIFSHKVVESNFNQSNNKQFQNDAQPLFCSVVCSEDDNNNGAYFLGLGLCSSSFLLFSNVKLSLLEKAHTANDFEQMKSIQMEMSMKEYNTSCVHTKSMTNLLSINNEYCQKFITIGRGQCCLAVWCEDFDPFSETSCGEQSSFVLQSSACSSLLDPTNDVNIIKAVQLFQYIYTLDSKGNICLWHSDNLVLCKIWRNTNIKDFTITHAGLGAGKESAKLYAATQDEQTELLEICVFNVPKLTPIFTYSCSGQGFCNIAIGSSSLEDIVYVDGDLSGNVSSISLHRICEALPEDRVLRLLNKRRFDEAEKFALTYNLDVQQVYHQKASFLASMISNFEEIEGNLKELFEELVECLKKLKDDTVIAEICLDTIIPDVHMNYKLLDMGRSSLAKAIPSQSNGTNGVDKADERDILLQIINRMDRLVTFRVAHGYSQEDGAEWIRFCNADLPMELMRLLSMGNISAAATVLLRHKASLLSFLEGSGQSQLDLEIVEKHLQAFLEHIPNNVDIDVIVRWLEDSLVPTLLPRISCSLKVIAVWLHSRAESYEHSNPSEWPEIGLKMANVLFNVQNNLSGLGFMRDQLSSASQSFKSTSVEVARLRLLASRLQLLLQLKQKYKCNVTLAEFIEETTMSLTYRMLDRVMVPELIPSVLQMTVRPYMREHELGEEEVLLGYVEDLLSRFRDQSWGSVESLRERKIVAIIQCMGNKQVLLEATVKLAKRASVPWSEDIHHLIDGGIRIAQSPVEHEGSGDIEKNAEVHAKRRIFLKELQYSKHIEQLPTVLAEYGISNIVMSNSLSHEKIVQFLIHQGTEEALDQARYFCRTFTAISDIDMYRFRLISLLEKGKTEECMNLLQEAEKENFSLATTVVKRAIGMVEIFLEINKEDEEPVRLAYCNTVIQMIEYVLKQIGNKKVSDDQRQDAIVAFFQEKLDLLKNIVALQTQCSEILSVDEFKNEKYRTSLVSRYIDEYSSTGLENEDFTNSIDCSTSGNRTKLMSTSIFQDTLFNSTQKIQADDSKLSDESQEGATLAPTSKSSLCQVLNLARILQVPSEKLRSWIALNAAKNGGSGIKTAAHLCRELLRISPTEDVAEVTFNVVIESLKHLTVGTSNVMELISKLLNLSITAMMYCKPDQMNDGMAMCKFSILCDELRKVVDDKQGIFSCRESVTNKDPYSNITTLYPWLEDGSGLMLQSDQVLPIFMKMAESLMNNGNTEADITMLHQLALEMTTTLQGARQSQLSMLWTITCVGISLRRMADLCNPLAEDISNTVTKQMLTLIEELNKILPEYVDDCIKKVLSARVVDVSMVVGLLTLVPISRAHKLLHSELNKAGNNCKRIMSIAKAGIATLRLNNMDVEVEKFKHLFLDSRWGELLQPLQIQFDQAYFSHPSSKTNILKKLIHHPDASGKLIKEFCLDYDLDLTSALLEFTRVLLSDSNTLFGTPELRKLSMSDGEGTLMSFDSLNVPRMGFQMMTWEDSKTKPMKNEGVKCKETEGTRQWPSVKKEMAFVMSAMNNKNDLCHQMVKILRSECSPYHYKRAKFILNLIAECMCVQSEVDVKKGLELIECLKLVKRSGPVSEYERQHWNFGADLRTMHKLPDISKERLPLHPLLFGDSSSTWKILSPELNEHSATRLAPIARILSLNIDKLYITAADNFIGAHMSKDKDHQLSLTPQQLNSVKIMTKEVKDYRMATAMAKRVAGLLPISEQKVQAYEWCTELAETWRNSVSEEDPDYATIVNTHRSLRGYFHSVAVELVLQKHKLTSDNVTVLTSSPEKLILLLYQHPTIVKRYFKPDAESYPDIHSATNEIAEIHSLNIFKLRMSISMEWLLSANFSQNSNPDEDSTVNLANMKASNIVNSGPDTASSMNNDVIKLLYVLSHVLTKQTAKFLLAFAFDKKNTRVTNACRVRALQCVLQLFNDDLIEELTNEKVDAIREKLRLLIYLSELESIGFSISGAQLQRGKKDEVARSILASPKFRHNTQAICVASELCREYNAWCPSTWQLLLQQMVALRQISYLRHLLPDICCHPNISSLPCLATVWQSCVTSPLAAMTPPLNSGEVNAAVVSYHFLLACPVLLQIDLIRIAQHFCSIELPLLALGCLLADPSQDDNSKKLALANYDLIQKQLNQHPTILGQRQIVEVLRLCDIEK